MKGRHEDEVDGREQEAVARTENELSVTELAEGLRALDLVDGDLERLKKERPDLEGLLPYLEVAAGFTNLRETLSSSDATALRQKLIDEAGRRQAKNDSARSDPQK